MEENTYTPSNKISVIIAAYNEEPRIAEVLKVVEKHPLLDEVIVVNDGSSDKTSSVVKGFKVRLIENKKNMGKTLSVKKGVEAAKNNLIMMLDADLKGLTAGAIEKLARPVLKGEVEWTLSVRKNSGNIMKLLHMDWISGERVIPKKLLMEPSIWSRPDVGYGLETLMNKSLLSSGKTFRSVYLPSLLITKKSEKTGKLQGWKDEIKMLKQIARVMPLPKVLWQFITMAYRNNQQD